MQYFIGITLPAALKEKIISFQNSFPTNEVQRIAEPHITVKAQGGLTEDESWINVVREAVENYPSFEINLSGVDGFGGTVLFLSPVPSSELIGLHRLLLEVVNPSNNLIAKYFEGDTYQPHITLGGTSWGMTKDDLVSMRELAKNRFIDSEPFMVSFVRIYRQQDLDGPYEKFVDLPLTR